MKSSLIYACTLALIFLTNCKKDTQTTTPAEKVEPKGTWSLTSESGVSNGHTFSLTTAQYPCMASNKIIMNADGTASFEYTSQDTCYIVHTATQIETAGTPGDKITATWKQIDNTVYFQFPNVSKPLVGQLSVINTKQQLIFTDTIAQINRISSTIFNK